MTKVLSVKNLHISFLTERATTYALRGVDFDLNANETLGIVGESGSGKSVLIKSLLRLLPKSSAKVDKGSIFFKDIDILQLKPGKVRKLRRNNFGFVFQDPMSSLNPTMKIGKQIEESMPQISRKMRKQKTLDLLNGVGITNPDLRANQYPHELSGGMRQRVMISIALAASPEVLIMDEPTTALDVTIQAEILKLIKTIKETKNMSIIFITHDFSLVSGFCDRVLVMYAGKVVESGPTNSLLKAPKHPYTHALLKSIPRLHDDHIIEPIQGSLPNMQKKTKNCLFSPRCPFAMPKCQNESPKLLEIGQNHKTRCFLYDSSD
ncbi:MAG: ABC transporter ATP-binding protein [Simkaniaceae bacterium]